MEGDRLTVGKFEGRGETVGLTDGSIEGEAVGVSEGSIDGSWDIVGDSDGTSEGGDVTVG